MAKSITIEVYLENNYLKAQNNNDRIKIQEISSIPWTSWFHTWLTHLVVNLPLASKYELSLRLTSDREITYFNYQYRQKKQPTDVLAFAALESDLIVPPEVQESLYLGDIIISLDTADQQAQEQNHSLVTELAWLASHGFLHLLGWDHPDDASLNQMLQKQANLLKLVEITD